MSIWGTVAGIGVGIVTGNPALGATTAGVVNSATSGGSSATSCPGQKTAEIQWLMGIISPSDRNAWMQAAGGLIGAGGIAVADKIAQNDAAGVAFDAAGGADCKVSSDAGKAFTSYTLALLNRYEQTTGLPQTPAIVTQPGTSITGGVTVTGPGGVTATVGTSPQQAAATLPLLSNPILLVAAAAVVFLLVLK